MTSFIGRRQELADLRRALSSYRLVTLTGVGGVGKTRLTLRMAETVRRAFRDGVWFVDFSAVLGPSLLIPTIRTALGLRDLRSEEPTDNWQLDQLLFHLADLQILLLPLASEPGPDRAKALIVTAHLGILLGFPAGAWPLLAEARSIATSLGDSAIMTEVVEVEGLAEVYGGEPRRVLELTGQALAEYRAMGDDLGVTKTLLTLAYAWTLLGDFTRGRACCQEALAICEAHNERWLAGVALWMQGLAAWFQHDIQQAKALQERSIRLRASFNWSSSPGWPARRSSTGTLPGCSAS